MYSRASVNSNWGYVLKMVSVTQKQDHLRMNVAPDQTGLQIFLDHRALSSIGHKIVMTPTLFVNASISLYVLLSFIWSS